MLFIKRSAWLRFLGVFTDMDTKYAIEVAIQKFNHAFRLLEEAETLLEILVEEAKESGTEACKKLLNELPRSACRAKLRDRLHN